MVSRGSIWTHGNEYNADFIIVLTMNEKQAADWGRFRAIHASSSPRRENRSTQFAVWLALNLNLGKKASETINCRSKKVEINFKWPRRTSWDSSGALNWPENWFEIKFWSLWIDIKSILYHSDLQINQIDIYNINWGVTAMFGSRRWNRKFREKHF